MIYFKRYLILQQHSDDKWLARRNAGGMETAELSRLIESLVREGEIVGIDLSANPPCARASSGALVTAWLPWLCARAGTTKTWDPPNIGEACLIIGLSGDPACGFILPSFYTARNPPPSRSPDEHLRLYPDGARVSYNHKAGALSVTGIRTAKIQASQNVTVDCPDTVFTGNVTVMKKLTYLGGMAGSNGGGSAATIAGPVTHTGGDLSSNGVVVHTHTHPGTGGPQ